MDNNAEAVVIANMVRIANSKRRPSKKGRKKRKGPTNNKKGSGTYFFAAIFLLVVSVALFISYAKNIPIWFIVLAAIILVPMDIAFFSLGFTALKREKARKKARENKDLKDGV